MYLQANEPLVLERTSSSGEDPEVYFKVAFNEIQHLHLHPFVYKELYHSDVILVHPPLQR